MSVVFSWSCRHWLHSAPGCTLPRPSPGLLHAANGETWNWDMGSRGDRGFGARRSSEAIRTVTRQRRGSDVIQSKTIAFTPQEPKERNQTDQSWPTIAVVQFHSSSSFDLVVSSLSVRLSHRTEPLVPLSSVSRALPQLSSPFPRLPFITNLAPRNRSTPSSSPISVY